MTADLSSRRSTRRAASWAGRASQHRRQQVSSGGPAPVAMVHTLWESLVDVLRTIDSPSTALLCTADGAPVAAYGLPRTAVQGASLETGTAFASRTRPTEIGPGLPLAHIETVEFTEGGRHTVIASVPGPANGDHLLSVTAEGVSLLVLQAWTRQAAEDLRALLDAQA